VQLVIDQESRTTGRQQGAFDVINIVSVGCNKGDDLVRQMQMWTHSKVYDVASFRNATQAYGMQAGRACPSEPYAMERTAQETTRHAEARVFGYCIEPMPTTFVAVEKAINALGLASHVRTFRYAVSSRPGLTWFAGDVPAGVESLGMETAFASDDGKIATDVVTIDQFAAAHHLREIHTLSVDTEGNDARVLIGAIKSLPRVRLLEFEYHSVGHWATADLQDSVDYLDNLGFTCFWAGNTGQLWRLTSCWHDSYYGDRWWSNVVCCNRHIGSLCESMENAS
jgi:FkbM family methyltransferase